MDQSTARSLARRISERAASRGVNVDPPEHFDVANLVMQCIDQGVDLDLVLTP